jgi:hypothetical protein
MRRQQLVLVVLADDGDYYSLMAVVGHSSAADRMSQTTTDFRMLHLRIIDTISIIHDHEL